MYDTYSEDIFKFSYWLSKDADTAKDITSETFIKAWNSLGKIRTETIKGFLLTIARNTFIDNRRKNKRMTGPENISGDFSNNPEKELEIKSELKRVDVILNNFTEIDRVLQISISSLKVKVHRIRKKLIEQLSIQGELIK